MLYEKKNKHCTYPHPCIDEIILVRACHSWVWKLTRFIPCCLRWTQFPMHNAHKCKQQTVLHPHQQISIWYQKLHFASGWLATIEHGIDAQWYSHKYQINQSILKANQNYVCLIQPIHLSAWQFPIHKWAYFFQCFYHYFRTTGVLGNFIFHLIMHANKNGNSNKLIPN